MPESREKEHKKRMNMESDADNMDIEIEEIETPSTSKKGQEAETLPIIRKQGRPQ